MRSNSPVRMQHRRLRLRQVPPPCGTVGALLLPRTQESIAKNLRYLNYMQAQQVEKHVGVRKKRIYSASAKKKSIFILTDCYTFISTSFTNSIEETSVKSYKIKFGLQSPRFREIWKDLGPFFSSIVGYHSKFRDFFFLDF